MPSYLDLTPTHYQHLVTLIATVTPTTATRRDLLAQAGLSVWETKVQLDGTAETFASTLITALQTHRAGETADPPIHALLRTLRDEYYSGQASEVAHLETLLALPLTDKPLIPPTPAPQTPPSTISITIAEGGSARDIHIGNKTSFGDTTPPKRKKRTKK